MYHFASLIFSNIYTYLKMSLLKMTTGIVQNYGKCNYKSSLLIIRMCNQQGNHKNHFISGYTERSNEHASILYTQGPCTSMQQYFFTWLALSILSHFHVHTNELYMCEKRPRFTPEQSCIVPAVRDILMLEVLLKWQYELRW